MHHSPIHSQGSDEHSHFRGEGFRLPSWIQTSIIAIISLFISPSLSWAFAPPSPDEMPESITVRGETVQLKDQKNPLKSDRKNKARNLREGRNIYFTKCYLCHGDLFDGKGVFGNRFFPPPANFRHPETSILFKPESYTFWRIAKGGKGLPKSHSPWDSAMPAWEDELSIEEMWKVVLYLFNVTGKTGTINTPEQPSIERGKEVYLEKCAVCHGETGKADGPAAKYSSPRPRKLSKGHIKFRTTPFGKIPTDDDLFKIISKGMPWTTMPSWKHIHEIDRWSLVLYIKTLTKKFAKFKKKGKILESIYIPDPPNLSLKDLKEGKQLFIENCSGCHGLKGRSDGESTKKIVSIATGALRPRNLTKGWTFRRGSTRDQLFLTIRTGLSSTSMPRLSPRTHTNEQIWKIVYYVQTLSPAIKPNIEHRMVAKKVSGDLPLDPDHPDWAKYSTYFVPLGGQIIESEKAYFPTVDNIEMKTVHNGKEVAFHIRWDDPTFDPVLRTTTSVEDSPAPPLPKAFQALEVEEDEFVENTDPQKFSDSLALQFPVTVVENGEKPYFLNGDADHPVNLWKWNSHPMKAVEMVARGMGNITAQAEESQTLRSQVIYRYGQYRLVIIRSLDTSDTENDIQFIPEQVIPLAFNVWDGTEGETKSKKAISTWYELILE